MGEVRGGRFRLWLTWRFTYGQEDECLKNKIKNKSARGVHHAELLRLLRQHEATVEEELLGLPGVEGDVVGEGVHLHEARDDLRVLGAEEDVAGSRRGPLGT